MTEFKIEVSWRANEEFQQQKLKVRMKKEINLRLPCLCQTSVDTFLLQVFFAHNTFQTMEMSLSCMKLNMYKWFRTKILF